jgi:hypothetical protein
MKYFIFYIAILLMLPFAGNTLAQSENLPSSDSTRAEAVMNQYFTALASGDVATLRTLLGGRLKAKRTPLPDNPEYAGYLATTHLNTSFQIPGIHSTSPNTVSVDVLVSFSPDETIHKTYTLKRDASGNDAAVPYQIVSEATAAN